MILIPNWTTNREILEELSVGLVPPVGVENAFLVIGDDGKPPYYISLKTHFELEDVNGPMKQTTCKIYYRA